MPPKTKRAARKPSTEKPSSHEDRLDTYRAKRDFEITPEPGAPSGSLQSDAPGEKKTDGLPAADLAFVVQKHDARRLHYDVRLEVDGAMVSWAVPKGPSYDPSVKRLAVQTEDHPMAYNAFEGRIPAGEYGAGDVLIWDAGSYETVPPGQQRAMLDKGHMHVRLFGSKLVGQWHLVRTKGRGGDDGAGGSGKAQWLMFKAKDTAAKPAYDVVAERPESIVSGRTATRGPDRVGASGKGASARALYESVGELALATVGTPLGDPGGWLFEVKYDGYRLLASKAAGDVRLHTRGGHDWTDRFAPIARAIAHLPARECVVDGEACVVDEKGRPSFAALQEWLSGAGKAAEPGRLAFAAFDLLWLDGRDLRAERIEARRELLERLLEGQAAPLSLSRAVQGELADILKAAKSAGLEGLMAKKKGSPYVGGRTTSWVKLRFDRKQDCAVAGWLPMAGTKDDVGALLVAVADGGKLVYAGRVGTGFDSRMRRELWEKLRPTLRDDAAIDLAPRVAGARWVEPKLVCECVFTEWTRDGSMRHPRFLGMREDKKPLECIREGNAADADVAIDVAKAPAPVATAPVKLSNPTKVLFPRDAITKRDIWDYYTAVAPWMLPHLAGRPLTLQRYPDGIDGEEWYQQNAPEKSPPFVRLVQVGPHHGVKKRIVCDRLETLQWLANLAALTIHQWTSRAPAASASQAATEHSLASPDYVVLDLDPGSGPWEHLVRVARAVRTLLDALGLVSLVKTSGKRGVHIVVPIAPGETHEAATSFAEQVARAVAKVLPDIATVERMKDKRGGKLYVDYGQNGEGRTIVSPYTIRARDGAVVSTPIAWEELDEKLDPTRFTIRTVLARADKHGDLFARALGASQRLPTLPTLVR
jgi:bifunctional non-homologous end joining protein LigD